MSYRQSTTQNKRVAVPAMLAGVIQDVSVVWDKAMPSSNYNVLVSLVGTTILNVQSVTNITPSQCVVTVKNIGLTSLLVGTAVLHATAVID